MPSYTFINNHDSSLIFLEVLGHLDSSPLDTGFLNVLLEMAQKEMNFKCELTSDNKENNYRNFL